MSEEDLRPAPDGEPGVEEDITATINHAHDFDLPPRQEGESANAFRERISSALRDRRHMVEAHEAWTGKFFDEDDAATGIIGAVAMRMQGTDYGTHDGNLVGDEIATGHMARAPKSNDEGILLFALPMTGGDRR